MDEDLVEEIKRRIEALQVNDTFFLKTLLADVWGGLGDGLQRRRVGIWFAQAVHRGDFPLCRPTDALGRIRDVRYIRVAARP